MNINNKIRVVSQTEIELLEDAKKGDIIDLANLNQVDTNFILRLIDKNKKAEYEAMLSKEISVNTQKLEAEYKLQIENSKNELKEKYSKEIENLKIKLNELESNKAKDIELSETKVRTELDKTIDSLKNEVKNTQLEKDNEWSKKLSDLEKTKDNEISNLKLQLKDNEIKITNAVNEKEKSCNEKYDELKRQFDELRLSKSMVGIKDTGENLEQWCNDQYLQYSVNGFDNCSWEKDNKAVGDEVDPNNTKGDFIFKVFADNTKKLDTLLTSALLDMKDENPDSTKHKKNSEHYEKLDGDRRKKGCEYAILVSNLERNREVNTAPVIRVTEYEKMYVVRPEYLMFFLSLLASLAKKYTDLIISKKLDLLNKEEATKMFNELKDYILVKSIAVLEKDISDMQNKALKIKNSADEIFDTCEKMRSKKLRVLKEKIEGFKLTKAVSALE